MPSTVYTVNSVRPILNYPHSNIWPFSCHLIMPIPSVIKCAALQKYCTPKWNRQRQRYAFAHDRTSPVINQPVPPKPSHFLGGQVKSLPPNATNELPFFFSPFEPFHHIAPGCARSTTTLCTSHVSSRPFQKRHNSSLQTYSETIIRPSATSETNITVPRLAGNFPLIIHCCAWK